MSLNASRRCFTPSFFPSPTKSDARGGSASVYLVEVPGWKRLFWLPRVKLWAVGLAATGYGEARLSVPALIGALQFRSSHPANPLPFCGKIVEKAPSWARQVDVVCVDRRLLHSADSSRRSLPPLICLLRPRSFGDVKQVFRDE